MTALRRPATWVLAFVFALALFAPRADGVRCGDHFFDDMTAHPVGHR